MEQRKIKLSMVTMTSDLARSILTHERYEGQRQLDQSFVQAYALDMRNGEFRQGTLISFCVYKGKRYLVNGQHTLEAICLSGVTLELAVEEIQVESLEERAYWFGKYDRPKVRSLKQIYEAHVIHESLNFNKSQSIFLGGCLPLLATGFSSVPRAHGSMRMYTSSPRLRMDFMRAWTGEAEQFYAAIKGSPGSLGMNIRRSPVFAVALVTYRFQAEKAEDFWFNVCQDDGLNQGDVRKSLHVFLLTSQPSKYEPHEYSRYIAQAWNNAWYGQRRKNIQPQAAHNPILIEGTPHNGKDVLRYISPRGEVLKTPIKYDAEAWQKGLFGDDAAAD
jgi:hypothetical protein